MGGGGKGESKKKARIIILHGGQKSQEIRSHRKSTMITKKSVNVRNSIRKQGLVNI